MGLTIHDIQDFIISSETDKSMMHCQFRNNQGEVFEASARIKNIRSVKGDIQKKATRIATSHAKRTASRLLRRALGGGMMGRIGSSTARSLMSTDNLGVKFTKEEKDTAIVDAFEKVAEHFQDDLPNMPLSASKKIRVKSEKTTEPKSSRRSAKDDSRSDLEKALEKNPIVNKYDKEILGRILVDISYADGKISEEEMEFLSENITEDMGSISSLKSQGAVSAMECSEVSRKVKENIYALAWLVSLSDFDVSEKEEDLLLEYGDMLGLMRRKKAGIIEKAKFFTLEQCIDEESTRDDIHELSEKIKLAPEDGELCWIRWKKKQ